MKIIRKIDDKELGAVDDISAIDDLGAVDDPNEYAGNPLEINILEEVQAKQVKAQKAQERQAQAIKEALDPQNWSLQQTKDFFKENPPKTTEEEARREMLINQKKQSIEDHETSAVSRAVRSFMKTAGLEQYKTAAHVAKVSDQLPQPEPGESFFDFSKRFSQAAKLEDREKEIAAEGTVAQFEDLMTAGIAGGLVSAPVHTAKMLAVFTGLEAGGNALGINKLAISRAVRSFMKTAGLEQYKTAAHVAKVSDQLPQPEPGESFFDFSKRFSQAAKLIEKIPNATARDVADLVKFGVFGIMAGGLARLKPKDIFGNKLKTKLSKKVLAEGDAIIEKVGADKPPEVVKLAKEKMRQVAEKGVPKAEETLAKGNLARHKGRTVSVQDIKEGKAEIVINQKKQTVPAGELRKVKFEEIGDLPEVKLARQEAASVKPTIEINTPARKSLRNDITRRMYEGGEGIEVIGQAARNKNRRADIVLGGPASGKSQVVNPLVKEHKALLIDNDNYKVLLPEYKGGVGAAGTHLESALIEGRIFERAIESGDNLVVARLGKNPKTMRSLIDKLNQLDYDVNLHFVDLPVEKAMQRTVNRFIERGRFVDPAYIKEIGLRPKETYDMIKTEGGVRSYESVSTDVAKGELPRRQELFSRPGEPQQRVRRANAERSGGPRSSETPAEQPTLKSTQKGRPAEESKSIENFQRTVEQGVKEMSPVEKAEFELEMAEYRRTPEGNLFTAIKRLGGIKPFKEGFMKEEMAEVPFYLKNKKSKHTIDSIVSELREYGWNFDSGEMLRQEIITQKNNPVDKIDTVGLRKIIREAQKNEKLQQKLEEASGKRRKFIQTVKSSERTAPEVARKVESRYEPISNRETMQQAQEFIDQDPNGARELILGPSRPNAFTNAVSIDLIRRAQSKGNFSEAVSIVERTAEKQTQLGQAIQALSMYNRLSPEGVLMLAQRTVNQAKGKIRQQGRVDRFEKLRQDLNEKDTAKLAEKLDVPHISEIVAKELQTMAERIQEMPEGRVKDVETALMLKKIADLIPKSLGKKVSMIQTLSQLLNPKTFIRNLLGNIGFQLTEGLADPVATALDVAASLRTGQRTTYLPSAKTQFRGFMQGLKEGTEEALKGISLKESTSKFTLPKHGVFDKGVMGALEKTLRISLGATDRAFYQAAFNQSIRDQMLNLKRTGKKVEEPTAEMIERAHQLGLYRTFQDNNVISRQFVTLKRWFNANRTFGLGDIILKYPKTPANLLARGIEYSPFGFFKTVYEFSKPLMGDTFNQESFVRSTSRAITGSVLQVGTGALLAELGIISGRRPKDYDLVQARREVGLREYQVNVTALKRFMMSGFDPDAARLREDDFMASYDWMLPASIGIALGANMVIDPKTNLIDKTMNFAEQMAVASETLQEQPLVSGVRRFAKKQNVAESFTEAVQQIPATFVPTLLNQVRQLTNNTARNTKDPNYFKEAYNKAIMRIPGLSQTLPPRVTPLGQDQEMYQLDSNNPFNVFLNPAFVSKYKPDPVSNMVLQIWEMSGERVQFPRSVRGRVKLAGIKEQIDLTAEQYTMYQRYVGNKTDVLFSILASDKEFLSLSMEGQSRKLQRYLTDINSAGKIAVLGNQPKSVTKTTRMILEDDVERLLKKIDKDIRRIRKAEEEEFGAIDDID